MQDRAERYLREELRVLEGCADSDTLHFGWLCRRDRAALLADRPERAPEAMEQLEQALLAVQELGLLPEEAELCEQLARLARGLGSGKAVGFRRQAAALWAQLPYRARRERAVQLLAHSLQDNGMHFEAVQTVQELAEEAGDLSDRLEAGLTLARSLLELGELRKASGWLQRLRKEAKANGMDQILGPVYGLLGRYHLESGDLSKVG